MAKLQTDYTRHNVNHWIVPLKMSLAAVLLFGFTITPDVLAAHHVIHLPTWFTMGGIDDADPATRSASAQTPTPEWEDNQMKKSPDSVPRLLWD